MRILVTGQNQYDFIDYPDFCKQVAEAVGQQSEQGIINICSGRPEKLADRVERFIKENNFDIELQYGAFPDTIMDIARRHNLMVVEDAAQGVMSTYKGRALGTIGDFGCYSFHETKNYHIWFLS